MMSGAFCMNKTRIFRDLHADASTVLILPNVWDAGGARLAESLGAKAIATTSAGVAWSKGFPDGNILPARLQAQLAAEIVDAVKAPVSIDFEAGYAEEASAVVEHIKPVLAAGISGINLEDGTDEPTVLARKIEAIKKLAAAEGVDIFLNARTDVYLQDLVADEMKVAETLRRAKTYEDAGADGLFVPGLTGAEGIAKITQGTRLPINLMADAALPDAAGLAKLNVRRLSAGIGLTKIIFGHMARLTERFLQHGDSQVLNEAGMSFSDLQNLFKKNA